MKSKLSSPRKLITTENGTLSSLFTRVEDIPQDVKNYIYQTSEGAPLQFSFDSLPPALKVMAIKESIILRKLKFNDSAGGGRIIPGIKVKEIYQEQYELRKGIDLGSPNTVKDGEMLEFHVRSSKNSGDLVLQANKVYAKMGNAPGSMHMHIVMPLIHRWLQQNPKINTWRFIEFWRRVNLTFEMYDVVEKGVSIIENKENGYINFAPLQSREIEAGFNYLYYLAKSARFDRDGNPRFGFVEKIARILKGRMTANLGTDAKMGWVGFWGHDKYDGPGLMGFEFRFLDGQYIKDTLRQFLSRFAEQVQGQQFSLSEKELMDWFAAAMNTEGANQKNIVPALYSRLSPHQSYQNLFAKLPFEFQRILLGMNREKVESDFIKRGRLRYILHDWSQDPIFIGKEAEIQKIRNAQLRALRRWARGENETQVLQEFLIESELYFTFADSISFQI